MDGRRSTFYFLLKLTACMVEVKPFKVSKNVQVLFDCAKVDPTRKSAS